MKSNFDLMNENYEKLKERLLDIIESSDFDDINSKLSSINQPTIVMGSGGSSVACHFVASVLNKVNNQIAEAKRVDQVLHLNLKPFGYVLNISYSGDNFGSDTALNYAKAQGIKTLNFSSVKTNEQGIFYNHTIESENSFISLAGTIAPMVITLCYYLKDKEKAKQLLNEMFDKIEKANISAKEGYIYEVVGLDRFPTASNFFESALSESSIGVPVVSCSYDMCHGRTTSIMQQKDRQILYLMHEPVDLDQMIHARLRKLGLNEQITDVYANFDDEIVNDFYLTLYMAYWCKSLAEQKGIDLASLKNSDGEKLFLRADPESVKVWEQEHGRKFFAGKKEWKGLTSFEGHKYKYNIGAPTKFSNASLTEKSFDDEEM